MPIDREKLLARMKRIRERGDEPCVHRGATIDHIQRTCCGNVARFACARTGRIVEETKCKGCTLYSVNVCTTGTQPFEAPQAPAARAKGAPRRILLTNWQAPGDLTMLTAAIRDLHKVFPGRYETDVRTSCEAIWHHNPYLTRFPEPWIDEEASRTRDAQPAVPRERDGILFIPCTYEISPHHHFVGAFHRTLGRALGIEIPVTEVHGDIHFSEPERCWMSQLQEMGVQEPFWIIATDGKWDYTAKWPNWQTLQEVVWRLQGKVLFIQTGVRGNFTPPLRNVVDFIGQTDMRMLIRLIYHAAGVLCSVNGLMHLAAAVPTKPELPAARPCVVLAGGREQSTWEHYPWHRWLGAQGTMPCCTPSACWKSRCTPVGDGDAKDNADQRCQNFNTYAVPEGVDTGAIRLPEVRIPKCLDAISAADIVSAIQSYYTGGLLK